MSEMENTIANQLIELIGQYDAQAQAEWLMSDTPQFNIQFKLNGHSYSLFMGETE